MVRKKNEESSRYVRFFRVVSNQLHDATPTQPNQPKTMKTLINIVAIAPTSSAPSVERTFSFVRPASAKSPTYRGAERMVAKEVGCKPSQVSAIRFECMSYDA